MRYVFSHFLRQRSFASMGVYRLASVVVALVAHMNIWLLHGLLVLYTINHLIHLRNILSHSFEGYSWFLSGCNPGIAVRGLSFLRPLSLRHTQYLLVFLNHLVVLLDLFLNRFGHFIFALINILIYFFGRTVFEN